MSRTDEICSRCRKVGRRGWMVAGKRVCARCQSPSERKQYPASYGRMLDQVITQEDLSEKRGAGKSFHKEATR